MDSKTAPRTDVSFYPQDGYTLDGFIEAIPKLHSQPLRFQFRPLPHLDYVEIQHSINSMSVNSHERRTASMMAARIVGWDQLDQDGNPAEVTAENVLRLGTLRFRKLFSIIVGVIPSDDDPLWTENQKTEAAETEWRSVEEESTVGLVREESDSKN